MNIDMTSRSSSFQPFLRTALLSLAMALAALFLSGCLTFEETLVFSKNGSLAGTLRYHIPATAIPLAETSAFGKIIMDKAAVQELLQKADVGLTLYQHRNFDRDGIRHIEIIILAPDAKKALASGIFGKMALNDSAIPGDLVFSVEMPALPSADISQPNHPQMFALLNGFKATLTIQTPTEIIETNATTKDFNMASWTFTCNGEDGTISIAAPDATELKARW